VTLNRLAEAVAHRKALTSALIAEPEWIEGTGTAISMGSAMGCFTNCAMMEWCADLPDVSKCFAGKASVPATPLLLCMGLFSIF